MYEPVCKKTKNLAFASSESESMRGAKPKHATAQIMTKTRNAKKLWILRKQDKIFLFDCWQYS